jgi:hypothetical protein
MKYFFFCLLLFKGFLSTGQQTKTKILLVGTIHFETPHKDKFELDTDNFLSTKRQAELEILTTTLAKTKASKVMIERPAEEQSFHDSLYTNYLKGKYSLSISEREQIGFRLAKKLHLQHINCVDQLYGFPHDSIMNTTLVANNQRFLMDSLMTAGKNMLHDFNKKVKEESLSNVLNYLNEKAQLKRNLSLYLKYLAKVGASNNLAGAEYVSDWYMRNLAIYSTILSQTQANDQYIVVIFGQGHIPILKHLFENNPDFEVIELKNVLK